MGDAEEYKSLRKQHFSALRRLVTDWVDAFMVTQYGDRYQHIDAAKGIWLRCWLGFEALAFVLYRISGADKKANANEAFGILVPSAVEGSLPEAMGKYFDGALKSEKRKKRQPTIKKKKLTEEDWKKAGPSVNQLILVVGKSQLDLVVEYGKKLEDQILTRLSLFSKLTCIKMDRFRAVKRISENDRLADKGCTDICRKYHLLIGRNLAEQEFLETCSAPGFGRYERLLLELRNELLRMEQNCFCCDAGHGGHEAYREELEVFYCKGARGGSAKSCKDPGYRNWGELYLYRVLKLLGIDPEQELAEEVILPLRVFLSPLPTGWGNNRVNREKLEQAVLFLIHELGDSSDSYQLLVQHRALRYDPALLSSLKNTNMQDALSSGEEVIENG
ncbi:MAG: hypothetical protein L3J67_00950 [Hyphomicrobiaceae bacterium]|nr:hypothetical protein [Hyphomicrobiaceae bacterium]